jgi:class 3 adenylate cyclase
VSVQYARNGDAHIAYRVTGSGPVDLLYFSPLFVSFDAGDEEPHIARFNRRIGSFARLIEFDPRGIGLSDAGTEPLSIDLVAADALCVLDAAGSERAVLMAVSGAGGMAVTMATSAPERIERLVFVNAYARLVRADDYRIGYSESAVASFREDNVDPEVEWATATGETDVALMLPSLQHDARFREWLERSGRRAASPAAARRFLTMVTSADVRHLLPSVSAPTLVLARRDDRFVRAAFGRYIAAHIAGAKLVELPGADHLPFAGDSDALVDEVEEFVTGRRSGRVDRVVATLVISDIVDSTRRAGEIGDAAWRTELDAHDAAVRAQLRRFGGREVNTTGDGFFAAFDSPTSAVECAHAITRTAGVPVRVGVHTGECERRGDDLAGLTVHIAARVAASAGAGEVLVSRTVCDVLAGSSLRFTSRGLHRLRGVDGPWELFALVESGR